MLTLWPHVVDLLFPRTCAGCGVAMLEPGLHLCWDCRSQLQIISHPLCSRCGEPVHGRIDHDYVCHSCVRRPMAFHRARAAIHYNEIGKRLVTQFKYGHALWLENVLVELLESAVKTHYEDERYDWIAWVPLHPSKRRERGFNQAQLLAKSLAKRMGIALASPRWLCRNKMTPSQTRLTARQRLTNVKGAFEVNAAGPWREKRVLLVDDVMTTGATVSACADVLQKAGAIHVDVITVARGI